VKAKVTGSWRRNSCDDSMLVSAVERAERKERAQVGGCTEGLNRHDVPCCFSSTCTVEVLKKGRRRSDDLERQSSLYSIFCLYSLLSLTPFVCVCVCVCVF
jgi:hypothetical protein